MLGLIFFSGAVTSVALFSLLSFLLAFLDLERFVELVSVTSGLTVSFSGLANFFLFLGILALEVFFVALAETAAFLPVSSSTVCEGKDDRDDMDAGGVLVRLASGSCTGVTGIKGNGAGVVEAFCVGCWVASAAAVGGDARLDNDAAWLGVAGTAVVGGPVLFS